MSTLKAIFQGRRELFEGLALVGKKYDWQTYPVLPLDMGTTAAPTPKEIAHKLKYLLDRNAGLAPRPLLVQTGYLTIKGATQEGRGTSFQLGFPNFEIEDSFSYWPVRGFTRLQPDDLSRALRRLTAALRESRIETLNTGPGGQMRETPAAR